MKKALAFDIGGTKIYSAVIDETGNIVSEIEKFSTPKTLNEIKNLLKTHIYNLGKFLSLNFLVILFDHTQIQIP